MGNLVRTIALPVTLGAYFLWPSLYTIVDGFIVAEILALLVALALLMRRGAVETRPELLRCALFIALGSATLVAAHAVGARNWLLAAPSAAVVLALLGIEVRAEWATCEEALALVRRQLRLPAKAQKA
jgi:endonuclease/exonuclease/phosphatase (EEP) superfamily protein YafD